jgi:hypothetical protein
VPAEAYVHEGFSEVLVFPSPKIQLHDVGEFEEVSVKVTVSGTVPDVAEAEKEETGVVTAVFTVMVLVVEVLPTELIAVSVAV